MKAFAIFIIVFGIIIIIFPAIVAYLLGGFLIFVGTNILLFFRKIKKNKSGEDYVKFGNYKIYR